MQNLSSALDTFRDGLMSAFDTFEDAVLNVASSEATAPGQVTQAVTQPTTSVVRAQARTRDGVLHIQYWLTGESKYRKADVAIPNSFHFPQGSVGSGANSGSLYVPLTINGNVLSYNGFNLFTVPGAGAAWGSPSIAPTPPAPKALSVTSAQVALRSNEAHIQFRVAGESGYRTSNVKLSDLSAADRAAINKQATQKSLAGTSRRYAPMSAVSTEDGVSLNISGVTLAIVK